MYPVIVVEIEIRSQSFIKLHSILKGFQIDAFVLDTFPEAFDEYVIDRSAFAVHADSNWPFSFQEQACILVAGELAALV